MEVFLTHLPSLHGILCTEHTINYSLLHAWYNHTLPQTLKPTIIQVLAKGVTVPHIIIWQVLITLYGIVIVLLNGLVR